MASMPIIPQDIITTHILHRLPSESIGQFRCVSKEWLSLLTDPQFIKRHQNTLNKTHTYRSSIEFHGYSTRPLSFLQNRPHLGIFSLDVYHGSVNGLVLGSTCDMHEVYTLTVLNPTTNDYVDLPFHKRVSVFDDMLGFGYDSVTDDYKVVSITCGYDRNKVHVYSLRTNTWNRVTTDLPYYNYHEKMLPGVFVNGFLYWIVSHGYSEPCSIVVFSLADEKFSELQLPNNEINLKLVALGEKLAMFSNNKGGYIWLMNESGVHNSWTKIEVVPGFNEIPVHDDYPAITNVEYDKGKVVFVTRGLVWIYYVEEQTFRKSVDISNGGSYKLLRHMYIRSSYVESLVSPKFSSSK